MTSNPPDFGREIPPGQDRTQLTGNGAGGQGLDKGEAEFAPGDIIGGDYQVLRWIGAGGMGNVYCVRHTIMQTEYALKTLSADKVTEVAWRRFQNEAQAIARMQHPNIVAIYNLGLHDGRLPFYVMDLLRGPTMLDHLRDYGPMEVKQALPLFIELCAGFGYAHKKGIVHRDIKPPNIVLTESTEGGGRVKIVDFGIAKLSGVKDPQNQYLTNVGEVCGSPFYMSPEQTEGKRIDARSDIYSLGCTLFEMLTGTPPYRGRSAVDTMLMHQTAKAPTLKAASGGKEFPEMLEEIVSTLLAKQAMDRYQTMELLSQDLSTVLSGQTTSVNPFTSVTTELRRPETITADGKKTTLAGESLPERLYQPEDEDEERPAWHRLATISGIIVAAGGALGLLTWGAIFLQNHLKAAPLTLKREVVDTSFYDKGTALVARIPDADRVLGREERNSQIPTKSLQDTSPFSQLASVDGVNMRIFHFPDDITIGDIRGGDKKGSETAIHTIDDIKASEKVTFAPDPVLVKYPKYIERFRPGDIQRLRFEGAGVTDSLVKLTVKMPGIDHVQFGNCPQISADAYSALTGMKDLVSIGLENQGPADNVVNSLAKLKKIDMAELTWQESDNLEKLLRAAGALPLLQTIYLDNSKISHSAFETLSKFANLRTLTMDKSQFDAADIGLLAADSHLTELSLLNCKVTPTLITNLAKIKSLRRLRVIDAAKDRRYWTELSQALPKLRFFMQADHSDTIPANFGLP